MGNERQKSRPVIVIVGGGFAGINLAKKLRNAPVDIVLLDRHNYHTFQPLLYQVATGTLGADTIAFPLRRLFQGQKNFVFHVAEVQRVNPEKNTIDTTIGEIAYDYLVLATGATTNFFGSPQLEHFAMDMKTVPQALNLRSMILQNMEKALTEKDPEIKDDWMRFVIVGGGPTGVELAGALAEFRNHILEKDYPGLDKNLMSVYLIESKPRVLGVMSEEASAKAKAYLEKMGVILYNGVRVSSYDGISLQINNGTEMKTRNVLWAAGVLGDVPQGLPEDRLQKNRRIDTDEINRVKGFQNIFAIGDVAAAISADYPQGHPGVAQVAIQQGQHLATNLMALMAGRPATPFVYKDKGSLATIGRNKAVADLGKLKFGGFFAWLIWSVVHLFSLAGFKNRLFVFMTWIGKYVSNNVSTRLIIRPFSRELMTEDPAAK
ncbi:NAD(P)/FAD-dependent oxidoreductase [Paraflavisolibacter sp. H34]|uniref:NAD(P)/FAD-dependent oxidoreductase n=1 Tax=Huijunlia imazamoxiresistens TaxID=3127457 RepID=UPI003015F985